MLREGPVEGFAGMKWHKTRSLKLDHSRNEILAPLQHDPPFIEWLTVKARAILRCKGFQMLEGAFFIEHAGVTFQREGRVENPGAAAGGFLGADGVGR